MGTVRKFGGYKTKAEQKAAYRAYYASNRDLVLLKIAARFHRISPDEYKARRARPCEICGAFKLSSKRGSGMHVDHDHATGKLRGTLCDRCNRGLGMFDDSPEKLTQAIAYVQRYRLS